MPVRCNAYGATLTIAGEIDSIASGLFKAKSTGLRNKIRKVPAMKILLDVSVILIPLAIIVAGILYRKPGPITAEYAERVWGDLPRKDDEPDGSANPA